MPKETTNVDQVVFNGSQKIYADNVDFMSRRNIIECVKNLKI